MDILFLSTRSPLPLVDGNSMRTYNLLRLAALRHNVFFVSIVKHQEEHRYKRQLLEMCKHVELIDITENTSSIALYCSLFVNVFSNKAFVEKKYDNTQFRRTILEIVKKNNIDVVHMESLPLACYLDDFVRSNIVLSTQNVEASLLQRRVSVENNPLRRFFWKTQQQRLARFEKKAISRADHVVACSDVDKAAFEEMAPGRQVTIIPNGVDIDFFSPGENVVLDRNKIVFVGGMGWFPNRDGIEWFDNEILELLLADNPQLKVHIVGKSDSSMVIKHAANFVVHGFVDDIRPHVSDAAVFICPIRVGGGTRLKLLDAMAMGKAIVSTTVGAEGLGITSGEQMALADTPAEFANAIQTMISDTDFSARLGTNARAFVVREFSWSGIGEKLYSLYETACNH